jgi:hypothetical protein
MLKRDTNTNYMYFACIERRYKCLFAIKTNKNECQDPCVQIKEKNVHIVMVFAFLISIKIVKNKTVLF